MSNTLERLKLKFRIKNENQQITVDPNTGTVNLKALFSELQTSIPLSERIEYVKELSKIAKSYSLVEYINTLWDLINPLLSETKEARECAYEFLINLIEGNYDHLGLLRISIFKLIEKEQSINEFSYQFQLLCKLTNDGRNVTNLETKIAIVYHHWILMLLSNLEAIQVSHSTDNETEEKIKQYLKYIYDLLQLIRNTLKFNFIYIDEIYISYLISSTCNLCGHISLPQNIITECLSILDIVVRYGYVPSDALEIYVHTLCSNAKNELYSDTAFKIFNNLLKSHCAHNTIKIMCNVLSSEVENVSLVQGSVYFLGKASWGKNRLTTITYSISTILRYIMQPIQYQIEKIDMEILKTLKDLVDSNYKTLTYLEWEIVIEILDSLKGYCEYLTKPSKTTFNNKPLFKLGDDYVCNDNNATILTLFNSIIVTILNLYNTQLFHGSSTQYFDLLQSLSQYLSENLSMTLIEYFEVNQLIHPTSETWVTDFNEFVSAFYTSDTTPLVREKILNVINETFCSLKSSDCTILIEQIIIPIVSTLSLQKESRVIQACINLIKAVIRDCIDSHFTQLTHTLVECAMFNDSAESMTNILKNVNKLNKNENNSMNDENEMENNTTAKLYIYSDSVSVHNSYAYSNGANSLMKNDEISIATNSSENLENKNFEINNLSPNKNINEGASSHNFTLSLDNNTQIKQKNSATQNQNLKLGKIQSSTKPLKSISSSQSSITKQNVITNNININTINDSTLNSNSKYNTSNSLTILPKSNQNNITSSNSNSICTEVSIKSVETLIEIFEACFGGLLYKYCPIVLGELLKIVRNVKTKKQIRIKVLECLLKLRANSTYKIYLKNDKENTEVSTKEKKENNNDKDIDKDNNDNISNKKSESKTTKEKYSNDKNIKLTTNFMSTLLSMQTSGSRIVCHHENNSNINIGNGKGLDSDRISIDKSKDNNSITLNIINEKESVFENFRIHSNDVIDSKNEFDDVVLPINEYTETLIELLKNENDYDIHSYILTNWTAQLTNLYLFQSSEIQIKNLRKVLVDMVLNDRLSKKVFYNIPNEIRISDLYANAYRMLTILIAYSKFFKKTEQDELIMVFQIGLTKWSTTTRPCIHALLLSLLELPKSMTKLLTGTLVKMSQIMTASTISVHLLEFLSLLAGLPHLCVNFVENDYKLVFVIALKYIQSTLINKKKINNVNNSNSSLNTINMNSNISSNTNNNNSKSSSAFSQYVIYLAYHVVSVWFINLRLTERRKYVPFILQYITSGSMDERVECCLDMLTRYSYASCQNQPTQPLPAKLLFENKNKVITKNWIQGSVIISIKTLKNQGWSEIIIRRPTGTTSFFVRMENKLKMEENENMDLPALMMMHVSSDYERKIEKQMLKNEYEIKQAKNVNDIKIDQNNDIQQNEGLKDISENEVSVESSNESNKNKDSILESDNDLNINEEKKNKKENNTDNNDSCERKSDSEIDIKNNINTSNKNMNLLSVNDKHGLRHKRSLSSGTNVQYNSPALLNHDFMLNSHSRVHSGPSYNAVSNINDNCNVRRSRSASVAMSKSKYYRYSIKSENRNESTTEENEESDLSPSRINIQDITKSWTSAPTIGSFIRKDESIQLLPSFIYLQFKSLTGMKIDESDIQLLPEDDTTNRGISVLDRTPVVDLHKIGIVYAGRGQFDEQSILSNQSGSYHYQIFLQSIGNLVKLSNCQGEYTGGLDTRRGVDGEFAIMYEDEISKIVFHVATLMPTVEHDPKCMAKKRHIGNDYVLIVYNESGKEYEFRTIPGQFNFINIIITPVDDDYLSISHHQNQIYQENNSDNLPQNPFDLNNASSSNNRKNFVTSSEGNEPYFIVSMQRHEDMPEIGPLYIPKIISLSTLPIFIRQLAMDTNIYAQTFHQNSNGSNEYISNWGERLKQIKLIKNRVRNMSTNNGLNSNKSNYMNQGISQSSNKHFNKAKITSTNISHHINSALNPNNSNNPSTQASSYKRNNHTSPISSTLLASSSNDSVSSLNNPNISHITNNSVNSNSSSMIFNKNSTSNYMKNSNSSDRNNNNERENNNQMELSLDFTKYT